MFLKCNCFPHLATSISTVMRNSNFSNWPQSMQCTERVQHEFEAIILMVTWHHNERNRNPWSYSEIFLRGSNGLCSHTVPPGKRKSWWFFDHSICFATECWITQEKVVSDPIKYFLSLFSIKSLVFEAACLTKVRLFFFNFLIRKWSKDKLWRSEQFRKLY